jgi:hypothetical protein
MPRERSVLRHSRPRRYTYNVRRIRRTLSYDYQGVAELFHLHINGIRRWVKAGLPTIDDRRPHRIHGSDLIAFLAKRQGNRKRKCLPDEMYCCRCRAPRRPMLGQVSLERPNSRQIMIRGRCELCGTRMNRGGAVSRLSEIERLFTVTMAPARLDESSSPTVNDHFE